MSGSIAFSSNDYSRMTLRDIRLTHDTHWFHDCKKSLPIGFIQMEFADAFHDVHLDISSSIDGKTWNTIYSDAPSGNSLTINFLQSIHIARFIRIIADKDSTLRAVHFLINNRVYAFRNVALLKSNTLSKPIAQSIEHETYEYYEIDLALSYATDDDIVLELGSSLGAVSTVLLKTKNIKKYYCVEAHSQMVQLARANHTINNISNSILIHGVMCLDPDVEEMDFYHARDCWLSSLSTVDQCIRVEKVKTYCFNTAMKNYSPTFIICDIEHGEYDLFREGCDLSSVHTICMELHPSPRQQMLYTFLSGKGFVPLYPQFEGTNRQHVNLFRRQG